ncbi:MAG: 2,3-bisphosphoglycerate-independent phosphoglycerate mutase [Methanomassiliicoccales archaeon]|nr:MAG: 2,3-bisphosphoglycerate-independent phosphoglycerate mutase [Methanomassiliicoccales archaeon]
MDDDTDCNLKLLLIICDGLGDRPVSELGGKTPLQYADCENFDWFAKNGICGIMDTIAPGVPPGSDTAHLALLGHDPYEVYSGRGPFEAFGIGMDVKAGDVVMRGNFATVDDDMTIIDRRAGRIKEGTKEIAESLNWIEIKGVEIFFKEGTEHRAALVLRGEGLSPEIDNTDPHRSGCCPLKAKPLSPAAEKTAAIVEEFSRKSYEILKDHPQNKRRESSGKLPANYILLRGAGVAPHLTSLEEKFGVKSAAVVGVMLVKGVCKALGMEAIEVQGATGGVDTDMMAKAKAAISALKNNDFVLLHVKACDIYGHDGDALKKVETIGRLDDMLGLLRDNISNTCVALTADHATPVSVRNHSGDPVPLAIVGQGIRIDSVSSYDEISTAQGGLGRIRGKDLLPIMLDIANKSEMYGA